MSYVHNEETAISSEEPADVTALITRYLKFNMLNIMRKKKQRCGSERNDGPEKWTIAYMNSMVSRRTDPPFPINAIAVAAGTRPWLASLAVMGRSRANAPRPSAVAKENGTANQTNPPNK